VVWNGLPLIWLIIPKVRRMTRRITGIVQRIRLITNFSIACFRRSTGIARLPAPGEL